MAYTQAVYLSYMKIIYKNKAKTARQYKGYFMFKASAHHDSHIGLAALGAARLSILEF
jgi:hypothetical protein